MVTIIIWTLYGVGCYLLDKKKGYNKFWLPFLVYLAGSLPLSFMLA